MPALPQRHNWKHACTPKASSGGGDAIAGAARHCEAHRRTHCSCKCPARSCQPAVGQPSPLARATAITSFATASIVNGELFETKTHACKALVHCNQFAKCRHSRHMASRAASANSQCSWPPNRRPGPAAAPPCHCGHQMQPQQAPCDHTATSRARMSPHLVAPPLPC